MESTLFQTYREDFLSLKRKELDFLSGIQMPAFKKIPIKCCDIDTEGEYVKRIIEQSCITRTCRVLYYLEIESVNVAEEIIKIVSREKEIKRNKVKLPLVNKSHTGSRVLYVGKTNSNFPNRLITHLGLKSAATYALHLEHWAKNINLELSLHYAQVNLDHHSIQYLELLESILHEGLKPILGRSGH
jgi:hypothetical protein